MLKIKLFYTIVIGAVLVVLLAFGVYFSTQAWTSYRENQTFKSSLDAAEVLENYEVAVLNEILCKKLLSSKPNAKKRLCLDRTARRKTLENILKRREKSVTEQVEKLSKFNVQSQTQKISNFELFLGKKQLFSQAHTLLEPLSQNATSNVFKKYITAYMQILDKHYVTELENFLVRYYVSKKIPVSTLNVIFWDKIVEASSLSDIDTQALGDVGKTVEKILTSKSFYELSSKIDEMRITILTGQMKTNVKHLDWIKLLDSKSKALDRMKTQIKHSADAMIVKKRDEAFNRLLLYGIVSLMALLALVLFYIKTKREQREINFLLAKLNQISELTPYTTQESKEMYQMLHTMQTKEDAYDYIAQSFHLLNEKLKKATDDATVKSDFIATLSHEIRTPLNGILGFLKLLRDTGVSADQEEFLSLIEGSSGNLIHIVNDILQLSKINADKMEIEAVSFDIFDTVESTVSVFTYQTDQKDIELALFIDPFLSEYFLGDATKISQILTNLIGNAVKFTQPYGKISVFVQKIYSNDTEVSVKFAVYDNGIGLSEEQIEKIFNPYTQASASTGKNFGGTGLGLTISRKMVELMGGKLEVESDQDRGTTFFFTLTLKKDHSKTVKPHPKFENVTVGLALPVRSIKRQLDTNLEIYLRHFGAQFKIYYYDELFGDDVWVELPDIMVFDHHYARLSGELEQCASIECKSVLLTNSTLQDRLNRERHHFTDIIYTPITLHKAIRILNDIRLETPLPKKKVSKLEHVDTFEGLHVLVADDNMINRKLIKIIFEKLGVDVTLSENGQEAFDTYRANKYDIIFMDIQMPVLDGVEATQKILAYEKENHLEHTPIIALTANVAVGDKERYVSKGMDDYATKPVNTEILKGMILKHCYDAPSSEDKEK